MKLFVSKTTNKHGLYAVNLCVDGEWKEIEIDDYLPCGSETSGPCFSRATGNEIWVPILEKAWAKVLGSYERVENGNSLDAFRDLTGAPTEEVKATEQVWEKLVEGTIKGFIMCAHAGTTKASQRLLESMGLVGAHAYAVIQTAEVQTKTGKVKLVELRNPWSSLEWKGDWSDHSDKWTPELKKKLNFTEEDDGTFWMSFEDFLDYFSNVLFCRINDDFKYISKKFKQQKGSKNLFRVSIPQNGYYNFSANQRSKTSSSQENYEYVSTRLIIGKETDTGLEYIKGITGTEKNLWYGAELEAGDYQVFVEFNLTEESRFFTLSTYGTAETNIEILTENDYFLVHVYKSRALIAGKGTSYESYGLSDCIKYNEMLPEGYGYYYIKNNSSESALQETCYFKSFKNLALLPPFGDAKYVVTVSPGQDQIIIFKQVDPLKKTNLSTSINSVVTVDSRTLQDRVKTTGSATKRRDPQTNKELNINVYTLRHDQGVSYFYENLSSKILNETVTFTTKGLEILGYEDNRVVVRLGPGETQFIDFRAVEPKWSIQASTS